MSALDELPSVDDAPYRLRPIAQSDITAWYDYLSLPNVVEHTSWSLKSADELRPLVEWYLSDDPSSAIRFAIQLRNGGPLIGTIGFHTISMANRTAEIAYDLHPTYWGRGIASNCCRAVVKWGMAKRGFVRIQATVLDTNIASARVVEKAGFLLEGKLRCFRIVRNQPRDFWLYSAVMSIRITNEPPDQADVRSLIEELDRYQQALYPAESNHFVDLSTLMQPHVRVAVARDALGRAVGCAAVMLMPGYAEIKRMFVRPEQRGNRVGRQLLDHVESEALQAGRSILRLETGIHQPEALGLYVRAGYAKRGPFANYAEDPLSVFMEKRFA